MQNERAASRVLRKNTPHFAPLTCLSISICLETGSKNVFLLRRLNGDTWFVDSRTIFRSNRSINLRALLLPLEMTRLLWDREGGNMVVNMIPVGEPGKNRLSPRCPGLLANKLLAAACRTGGEPWLPCQRTIEQKLESFWRKQEGPAPGESICCKTPAALSGYLEPNKDRSLKCTVFKCDHDMSLSAQYTDPKHGKHGQHCACKQKWACDDYGYVWNWMSVPALKVSIMWGSMSSEAYLKH